MTTNISARNFSLTINGIDRTANVVNINLSQNELGEGGVFVSGDIELQANYNQITEFTYLASPSIGANWARGAQVIYKVANSAGVLTDFLLSGAALYILKEPAPPDSQYRIKLQIGDAITLKNYRTADTDKSGIVAGTSTARNTVIGRYLDAASVPNSLSSIPYPFAFPQPKTVGNGLGDVAAQMARAANHILYTNPSGIIQNKAINFEAAAIATLTIGEDERLFEQVDSIGIETPVDELVVSGLATNILATTYPKVTVNIVYANIIIYDLNGGLKNIRYISKRTTITDYGWNGAEEKILTYEEASSLVSGFLDLLDNNETYFLIPFKQTTNIKRYDSKNRLIYEAVETDGFINNLFFNVSGAVFGLTSFYDITNTRPTFTNRQVSIEDVITTYTYNEITSELLSKRAEKTIYFFGSESSFFSKTAKEEVWQDGLYSVQNFFKPSSFVVTITPSSRTAREEYNELPWQSSGGETIYSNDGSTQAPATVYRKPFEPVETQITVRIRATPFAGQSFYSRSRPVELSYLENEEQATLFANTYLQLLYGRKQGFIFGTALNDTFLTALTPLSRLDIIWRGVKYHCVTDGVSWSHTQTEMAIGMRLLVVGTTLLSDPVPIAIPIVIPSAIIDATFSQVANLAITVLQDQYFGGTFSQSGYLSCFVQSGIIIAATFSQSAIVSCTVTTLDPWDGLVTWDNLPNWDNF